jgi:hypothetical protein
MHARTILWGVAVTAAVAFGVVTHAAEPGAGGLSAAVDAGQEGLSADSSAAAAPEPGLVECTYDVSDLVGVDRVLPLEPEPETISPEGWSELPTMAPEVWARLDELISIVENTCGRGTWTDFATATAEETRRRPWITGSLSWDGLVAIDVYSTPVVQARVEEALQSLRAKKGYEVEIEVIALVFRVPHSRAVRWPGGPWEYPAHDLKALGAKLLGLPEGEVESGQGREFLVRPCPGRTSGELPEVVRRKAVWQHASGPAVIENGGTWEVPGLNGTAVKATVIGQGQGVRLRVALTRLGADAIDGLAATADVSVGQALVVCQPSAAWYQLTVLQWMGGEALVEATRQGRLPVLVVRAKAVKAPVGRAEAAPVGDQQTAAPQP